MTRLFQRRASTAVNTVLKKSEHGQRPQTADGNIEANVATSSGSAPMQSPVDMLKEMHANILFKALEDKLPCNSGLYLSAAESDLAQVIDAINRIVARSPDRIVSRLCSILEKLRKRSFSDGTFPEEVLASQTFILKTLAQCLNARLPNPLSGSRFGMEPSTAADQASPSNSTTDPSVSTETDSFLHERTSTKPSDPFFHSDSTSMSSRKPAPLHSKTVRYALDILSMFQSRSLDNVDGGITELYLWEAVEGDPVSHLPSRVHKRRRGKSKVADSQREPRRGETDKVRTPNQDQTMSAGRGNGAIPGGRAVEDTLKGARQQYLPYASNYAHDEALHGSYLRNTKGLIQRYAIHVLYHLSVSNWPVVFDRIKARLHVMAGREAIIPTPSHSHIQSSLSWSTDTRKSSSEESGQAATVTGREVTGDAELKLLGAYLMDRTRLIAILQEYLSTFRNMSTTAQGSASLALRNAILNWVVDCPQEFKELWTVSMQRTFPQPASTSTTLSGLSDKKSHVLSASSSLPFWGGRVNEQKGSREQLDRLVVRVFDMLHDSSREGGRGGAVLYPALAALICISPYRLESASGALEETVKVSSKNDFLVSLIHSLTSSTSSKSATSAQSFFACFEIVRFAFFIPPPSHGERELPLRTMGAHMALELKNFLINPSNPRIPFFASKDPIDVNFHAYCIAAIFRFHPKTALRDLIQVCLEPERSQAVKLAVVKALALLVVEASKYPWQPSLEPIFPVVTPRLRSILTSCSGHPEVIDGLRRAPSPFPICSSLAVANSNGGDLAKVINENLRLRVQINALFPLEPRFWLYGLTDADTTFLLNSAKVEHHCDMNERTATVMALSATLTRSLNIPPGEPCYDEAMRYLLIIAPTAVINAALMIINAIGDHELLHVGINVMHTMLTQLASGSIYGQDDAWRFTPSIMEAMILVETSLWCAVTSSQMGISSVSRECFRLMSVIQRHPAFPLPPYLSEADLHKRCAVLDKLGNPQAPIFGRFAAQKNIRNHVSLITYTPAQLLVFREGMSRFSKLTQQIEQPSLTKHTGHSVTGQAFGDQLYEWQNVLYMLAVSARPGMDEVLCTVPEHLLSLLPPPLQASKGWTEMVDHYIEEVMNLLFSENISLRQSAQDALGNHVSFKLLPTLSSYFDKAFKRLYETSQSDPHLQFIEQSLTVIKLNIQRIDSTTNIYEDTASDNTIMMGLNISRLPLDIRVVRLRTLYCVLVDIVFGRRHYFALHRVNELRHSVVDLVTDWIEQFLDLSSNDNHSLEFRCAVSEAQLAALKLFVVSVETLRIQPSELVTSSDPREYHRYMATLTKTLVSMNRHPDHTSSLDQLSKNNEDALYFAHTHELVISSIAHLLNNNSELYKKFCLERCYDPDIDLRVSFMKAFTRVLKLGHQFDQPHAGAPAGDQISLCQIIRDCKCIALSIVQVCPPHEVEALLPVLMHVFNTRHTLMDFLKTLIDIEVAGTASPSELFRSNTICNRMLAAFTRQYGFVYLRSILESLVSQMIQVPHGCSFELDPSKLRTGEDAEENAQILVLIAQAFIEVVVESVVVIPSVIREICHHIAEVVSNVWPDSKYHAIGAFMFLRFICPAIVSPKIVDIDISNASGQEHSPYIQRGLVLVAKIIQNLSNKVFFGKEAHLTVLNPFLEKNVQIINKFLSDTQMLTCPSYEDEDEDESFESGCDDIDPPILHRFLQSHQDKIGRIIESQTKLDAGDGTRSASYREAWETLRTVLMRPVIEPPILSENDTASHARYRKFMYQNRDRNTDTLKEIFRLQSTLEGYVFVLTFAKLEIDTIDFELFLYTIVKAVAVPVARNVDFDIIFDFTSFTTRSRLPNVWLRFALELLPLDIRRRWRSAYILNVNSDAQSFLSNIFYLFSGLQIARTTTVTSSVAELQRHFPEHPTIMADSYSASLESSQDVFEHTHQQIHRCWTSVTLYVGADYLRTVSVKAVELSPTLSSRIVESINLSDVDDIHRSTSDRRLILKHSPHGPSIALEYSDCDVLLKSILAAKQRSVSTQRASLLPASQTFDTHAILLAVGLLHACHNAEYVRGAAYELLTANCAHLNYPFDAQVPWRGSFIPANSLAFVINFSERISSFAPRMTLDFILQWSTGFSKATSVEKLSCLQYISPWIRNMAMFTDPSSAHFDEPRVRDCIRIFVDITIQEPEIYPVLQRAIWIEMRRLPPAILNIVIDELIQSVINSELDSRKCDMVADTLISISTIHTRAKVLSRLRTMLLRAFSKPIHSILDAAEWKPITVLTRLVLVAGHSPCLAIQNQLYAPEIAHLITMLGGTGSLSMRLSTYGMAVNLLQSLHMSRSDDGEAVLQLRQMIDDLKTPQALKLFGLTRCYPSSEISILEPASNSISTESLEKITEILLRALELGSQSVGLNNVWRARWMSLIVSTAVQASFFSQFRTFTVVSTFPNPASDDQSVAAMLLIFKGNLMSSTRDDEGSIALLRCMCKAVAELQPKSRYLGSIFWFAVSIIQAEQTQMYPEAIQLLQVTLETMERHGLFNTPSSQNPMAAVLIEARRPLWEAAVKLDELSNVSFQADFGFALTTILWDGLRVPTNIKLLTSVLTRLLKISIRAANPNAEPRRSMDATSMPLYLGLSICLDKEEYARLLEEDCHITKLSDDEPVAKGDREDPAWDWMDLEALGFSDTRAIVFAITLLLCLEDSNLVEATGKENIHLLWSGFVKFYPNLFMSGVLHVMQYLTPERLSHKMDLLFYPSLPESHYTTLNVAFQNLMTRSDWVTPSSTPGTSESSTSFETNNTVITSISDLSQASAFSDVLSESGMTGMLHAYRRPLRKQPDSEYRKQTTGYVADLLTLLMSQ